MTRQIVLDTETTGLNPRLGNRIIEIGCVELIDRKLTGNNFHRYINPERDSEEGALAVHGLTSEFLKEHPKFAEIVDDFLAYIKDAEIIIHNAPFDVAFLNEELFKLSLAQFNQHVDKITDTLAQAKQLHPGKRNSLDALCNRYEISNSHRKLHGALLDAELLADVFLAMSRGQNSFAIEIEENAPALQIIEELTDLSKESILILSASDLELSEHENSINIIDKEIKGVSIWSGITG
jgi:DNA polymerase-3 subunit epsilon